MSRVRDITKFLEETRKTNTNLKALRPSTTSTIDSAAVLAMKSASGMSVFSTLDSLPVTSLTSGQQAYVTETSRIYISNGNGWYNVAVVNATPALTLSASGTIALTAGSPTTITMTATDSDNDDTSLVLSLESGGDLFKFATVSQDSSVVTITPRTADSATALGSDGSATLTFKASDGINQATVQNTFTLSFGPDYTSVAQKDELYSEYPENSDMFGNYGIAITTTGNYIAVGANRATPIPGNASYDNDGKAYVYYSSDLATWSRSALIKASDYNQSHIGFFYGTSLALNDDDGSYLAIASGRDTERNSNPSGAVYIYTRSSTNTWTQQQKLLPPNSGSYVRTSSNMGERGVRLNADATLLFTGHTMSSLYGASSVSASGYVMMFARSGAGFATTATYCFDQPWGTGITGNPTSGDNHVYGGFDINSDGTYVATTCPAKHIGSNNNQGAVYVFNGSGTSWTATEILDSTGTSDSLARSTFGIGGVALNDDATVLIVGCGYYNSSVGEIIVYTRSGSTWTQRQSLTHTVAVNYFGGYDGGKNSNLDISGDGEFIVAGAANGGFTSKGTVVFKRGSGTNTWSAVKTLTPLEATSGEGHRSVISSDGQVLAIGAGGSTVAEGGGGTGLATTGRVLTYKAG